MDEQKHVPTAAEKGGDRSMFDLPGLDRYALLPGDPGRVRVMAGQWDSSEVYDLNRGFCGATGFYKEKPIAAISTGMGGPSAEEVLVSLAECGVDTFIRVGTTGSLKEDIRIGDLIINDASVRKDGTSDLYVMPEYPAAASFEVTMALIQAAERLGVRYHVGTGYTAGSFYTGQQRPAFGGYRRVRMEEEMQDLISAKVINEEMEASAVFTLSRLFGLRAGMCACVVAHRLTGEYSRDEQGIYNACRVGAEAIRILAEWDDLKAQHGCRYFYPELLNR